MGGKAVRLRRGGRRGGGESEGVWASVRVRMCECVSTWPADATRTRGPHAWRAAAVASCCRSPAARRWSPQRKKHVNSLKSVHSCSMSSHGVGGPPTRPPPGSQRRDELAPLSDHTVPRPKRQRSKQKIVSSSLGRRRSEEGDPGGGQKRPKSPSPPLRFDLCTVGAPRAPPAMPGVRLRNGGTEAAARHLVTRCAKRSSGRDPPGKAFQSAGSTFADISGHSVVLHEDSRRLFVPRTAGPSACSLPCATSSARSPPRQAPAAARGHRTRAQVVLP